MLKTIQIKNTNNLYHNLFSYTSYKQNYITYIQMLLKRNTPINFINKHHFLFIDFLFKSFLTLTTFFSSTKLFYFFHKYIINVHTGNATKSITYYTNKKLIYTNNLLFCGDFIFTRKFFTFKQLQPRVNFKILKKKKNRQINKLKKTNKFK